MAVSPSQSFTVTANGGLLRVLETTCHISLAFDPVPGITPPTMYTFPAIWDTGATASCISQRVVDTCGLVPIGMVKVQTADGLVDSETFMINLGLPNAVGFMNLPVTKGNLGSSCDVLIGMDVITQGDFTVTNKGGNTIFSFRVPSEIHIDFVKEHNSRIGRPPITHGGSSKRREKLKKHKRR